MMTPSAPISFAAALLLSLTLASCGDGGSSDDRGPRECWTRHEHQLDEAGAFSIYENVVTRLEPAGSAPHEADTGEAGSDVIRYRIESPLSLTIRHAASGTVGDLEWETPDGETAVIHPDTSESVLDLKPGVHSFILHSADPAHRNIQIKVDQCGAPFAKAAAAQGITVSPFTSSIVPVATSSIGVIAQGPAVPFDISGIRYLAQYESSTGEAHSDHQSPLRTALEDINAAIPQFPLLYAVGVSSGSVSDLLSGIRSLKAHTPLPAIIIVIGAADLPPADAAQLYREASSLIREDNAFLVAGVPSSLDGGGAAALGRELDLDNVGLYYPRISQDGTAFRDPAAAVGGRIAEIDERPNLNVWDAPAGIQAPLANAEYFERKITDADSGTLVTAGVNSLRSFPNYGPLIWGARTTSDGPLLQYVQTSRLRNFIDSSVKYGVEAYAFAPSEPATWNQITAEITNFMTILWNGGAFVGATPGASFSVTVDATNNPPASQQAGIINVQVSYAPLHPAEFEVLTFQVQSVAQ